MSMTLVDTRVSTSLAYLEDGLIKVRFKYNGARSGGIGSFDDYVKDCRAVDGRVWRRFEGVNTFPEDSAPQVRALVEKWNIDVAEEVVNLPSYHDYSAPAAKPEFNVMDEGKHFFIWFEYNPNLISAIRQYVPGASEGWKSKRRGYEIAARNIIEVIKFAQEFELTMEPTIEARAQILLTEAAINYEMSTALDGPDIDIPGLVLPLKPHQRAGVAYMLRNRRVILGDQPGLGKSVQSIATVVVDGSLPACVVCPNSLKYVWKRDIAKFFPGLRVEILNGGAHQEIPEADVVVVNYDILHSRVQDIKEHGFRALIIDESHYIKNGKRRSSCPQCGHKMQINGVNCGGCKATMVKVHNTWTVRRTDAVMQLALSMPDNDLVLLLTGTPINNRPGELVRQLEAIGRLDVFGGEWRFRKRYCPDAKTSMNLKELNTKLRENCFIRRLRRDVYDEDTAIENSPQFLAISTKDVKRYQEVEKDVVEYFAEKARIRARDEGHRGDEAYWNKRRQLERAENLIRIAALRSVVAEIKFDAMIDWIDNFLDSGVEKILVYAEHIDTVEAIYDRYAHMAVKIRGGVASEDRDAIAEEFQTNPDIRVFVGNITAAKEGLTLTESSDVIFCELAWSPTHHEQCMGRVTGRVNDPHGGYGHYMLAPDTIDETMYQMLQDKQRVIDATIDGIEIDEDQRSVESQVLDYFFKKGEELANG